MEWGWRRVAEHPPRLQALDAVAYRYYNVGLPKGGSSNTNPLANILSTWMGRVERKGVVRLTMFPSPNTGALGMG